MSTLTIQPSNIDTYLSSGAPDTNTGTQIDFVVGPHTTLKLRGVLKFDFSALPSNAVISSAIMSLYYHAHDVDPVGRTHWVYRLTQIGVTETGATWNKYDGSNLWVAAGGDYTETDGASSVVPASYAWRDWNITAIVQYAQANTNKIAYLIVKDGTEPDNNFYDGYYYSREYTTDLTLRPKLVINYTLPSQANLFFCHG